MVSKISFDSPPVREISLGVQFEPLKPLRTPHFGLFWAALREEFPSVDDKPPVVSTAGPIFTQVDEYPLPRVWLIHKSQNLVLQLQQDRFWFNWRRMASDDQYPGFDRLLGEFSQWVNAFADFTRSENIGTMEIQSAELVYVNHVPEGYGWTGYANVGSVFPSIEWNGHDSLGVQPTGVAMVWKFVTGNADVRADVKSGKELEGEKRPLLVFELRAKSKEDVSSIGSAIAWIQDSHEFLGSLFVALTSEEVRAKVWRQRDV